MFGAPPATARGFKQKRRNDPARRPAPPKVTTIIAAVRHRQLVHFANHLGRSIRNRLTVSTINNPWDVGHRAASKDLLDQTGKALFGFARADVVHEAKALVQLKTHL